MVAIALPEMFTIHSKNYPSPCPTTLIAPCQFFKLVIRFFFKRRQINSNGGRVLTGSPDETSIRYSPKMSTIRSKYATPHFLLSTLQIAIFKRVGEVFKFDRRFLRVAQPGLASRSHANHPCYWIAKSYEENKLTNGISKVAGLELAMNFRNTRR